MPNEGVCPECGDKYNIKLHSGIRVPESPLEKSQRLYARTRTIVLTVLGCVFLGGGLYAQFILKYPLAMYTVGFAGIMLFLFAIMSYTSESSD